MTPKEAHSYARLNSLPCPCCGQPVLLGGEACVEPSDRMVRLFKCWQECMAAGEIKLVSAEHAAHELSEGVGKLVT